MVFMKYSLHIIIISIVTYALYMYLKFKVPVIYLASQQTRESVTFTDNMLVSEHSTPSTRLLLAEVAVLLA